MACLLSSLNSCALYDVAWQHQPQRVERLHSDLTKFQRQVQHASNKRVCWKFDILSADEHPCVCTDV